MSFQPRSAAVSIVRPPSGSSGGKEATADAQGQGQGQGKKEALPECIDLRDQGCVYHHPAAGEEMEVPAPAPEPTPTMTASKGATLSVSRAAPVFVPKTPMTGLASPRAASPLIASTTGTGAGAGGGATPSLQPDAPEWPVLSNNAGLMGAGTPMGYEDPSSFLGPSHAHAQSHPHAHSHGPGPGHSQHYLPRQELTHHLYTPSLPFLSNPPMAKHPLHSFFMPDDLRHMIQARHDATYLGNVPVQGLPTEVGPYHSLMPLDHRMGVSKSYGYQAPVYRAISSIDGGVYCLRRIEGYKVSSQDAFSAMEKWRQMRHPNIVSLREAFTTKAFNDSSLMMVYDFHPNSVNLEEEHLNNEMMALTPRRKSSPPIPERLLWSYITQIANALKAVHSSGMALRGLDPSRVILTGKNRIRLTGVGILDVLSYDPYTQIAGLQHDDLVSLGKLIMTLCCEWFVPGQHPAAPLDHIARNYSPDVKNLVMYLCGKPPSGKNIDEVVSILGLRILNEFDAMQNYNDMLESELGSEVENGRLVRLMTKLGFINERAEFEMDPRWSDTGDRYILKLFRDHVFHSIGIDGTPVLDLSHVLTCLNKLDAGLDERIMLVSRDDQSCLVVSYREIKTCVEAAYSELKGSRR